MGNLSDSTPDDPVFTAVELQTLEKLNAETRAWITLVTDNQKKKKDHEMPAFTIAEAEAKMADLDREIKYLINKAKIHKPKPKKEEPKKEEEKVVTPPPPAKEGEAPADGAKEGAAEETGSGAEDGKTVPPTTPEAEEKTAPTKEEAPTLEKPATEEGKPEETKTQSGDAGGDGDAHKPDDEL